MRLGEQTRETGIERIESILLGGHVAITRLDRLQLQEGSTGSEPIVRVFRLSAVRAGEI